MVRRRINSVRRISDQFNPELKENVLTHIPNVIFLGAYKPPQL